MSLLTDLISKEYTLTGRGRWYHAEEHDSLVVDVEKDIFYWNSKGIAGDAYIWLTSIEGYSVTRAKEILRESKKFEGSFIHTIKSNADEEIVVYPKLADIFYENGIKNRSYWKSRLVSDTTIDRFKLGYTDGWFTIPIYQDGLFKNIQCRRDEPEKRIKSWYRHTSPTLFNSELLRVTSAIMISESPIDCMLLNQMGIPAVSSTGGANYWSAEWYKYFIHQKTIYVIYDNDSAGRIGARQVAEKLGEYRCKVFTFDGYDKGYDVGKYVLDNRESLDIGNSLFALIKDGSKYSFEIGKEK